jgi:hypothetical protein
MGLLTEMSGAVQKAALTEDQKAANVRSGVIARGADIFESVQDFQSYTGLANLLESEQESDQYEAGLTLMMLERTKNFIEGMKEHFGESTVTANLGALPRRVLDVVRIFYPNQIANTLLDIQPIDGEVGTIFTMAPRFTDTFGGVSAGDEIFQQRPTHNNYASEEFVSDDLGTGDAVTTAFSATPTGALLPVREGTVVVEQYDPAQNLVVDRAVDDGNGNIVGVSIAAGSTVDYSTGATVVNYSVAPANGVIIRLRYCYSSEVSEQNIRAVEFDIREQPVKAKMHPITFKYTVSAGLAAKAHLAIDVQDTLAQLCAQYIKIERDEKVVKLIAQNATPVAALNFNATAPSGYQRNAFYGEIELKLDEAESQIQQTQGRGGVDFVLCGRNAANIFRNVRGFEAVPNEAPIGPHVIGTLRDGTVTVVKIINDTVLGANEFVFGYKGYMAGDAATILAEWIPVYFTPTFQSPRFQNEQGVMSMYDLFVNNAGYYVKGTVSNYSA